MKRSEKRWERDNGTRKLARAIGLHGGAVSRRTFVSKWSVYCDDPVKVYRSVKPGSPIIPGVETLMDVPCRRCEKCMRFKQMQWRERALSELGAWPRTWYLTLTFAPVHLAGVLAEAAAYQPRMSREAAIDRAAYKHLQRWLKRLRKEGHELRYLAVYENGSKTGRSHYHMLLHEVDAKKPVRKTALEEGWSSFVHARLVSLSDRGVASYLTKYMTKSLGIRPRASLDYGAPVTFLEKKAARAKRAQKVLPPKEDDDDARRQAGRGKGETEAVSLLRLPSGT